MEAIPQNGGLLGWSQNGTLELRPDKLPIIGTVFRQRTVQRPGGRTKLATLETQQGQCGQMAAKKEHEEGRDAVRGRLEPGHGGSCRLRSGG